MYGLVRLVMTTDVGLTHSDPATARSDMMSEAVIYLRVSTANRVDNYSLDNQLRSCTEYCVRNGITIARVFREEGESAKTAARTQLTALLNYCAVSGKKDGISLLIVDRVDRLARNAVDYTFIRHSLNKVNIQVRAVQENFDDSPAGRPLNLMASLAQLDNDARAARTRDGMKAAAAEGRWIWRTPVGFVRTGGIPWTTQPGPRPDRLRR